jgi:hypothetical protein
VVARSYLEEAGADPHAEGLRRQILGWLGELDLLDALEAGERAALERPVGRLGERSQVDASWLSEGLAVWSWALGKTDWLSPEEDAEPKRVADALGFLRPEASALLSLPTLRPPEELEVAAARLELLHARLVAFAEKRVAVNLEAMASASELGPLVLTGLPLEGGDLRLGGRALAVVPEEEWRHALALAEERVRAGRWLVGGPVYGLLAT